MFTLDDIAQNVMDLYYSENKSDDDFFKHYHFKYLCATAYPILLQTEFNNSRKISNDDEVGMPIAFVSSDWFIAENIKIAIGETNEYEAVLKNNVFSFQYDEQTTGLNEVIFNNKKCGSFNKIQVHQLWELKHKPITSDVFGYVFENKIRFYNAQCGLNGSAIAYYLPAPPSDENANISIASPVAEIIRSSVYQVMNDARKPAPVIDMTADQNKNKILQTELEAKLKQLNKP